ncbi:NAD-dependent 4,6-dehydratase LegB [Caproiciproducens faecalis]|uniref:SDR family oxidoreductase n=1 Tax=Caproiciproducens faecalis TaxID=2820301 RepID=A0ABS7DP87_9FIRM|nr:NAD-dependent 4,6-dehydratase LegB [Caproiciproducens faecalis]MBW7572356.1 SDR family oxidoreductase [Caproiciproducens faecalis]
MDLNGKKILVTGADGFIGSHLTEELVRRGYSVRAFVCYNSYNSWGWLDQSPAEIKDALEVVAGDIRDSYRIKKAMENCEVVFHLAALVAIPYSYYSPGAYIDTNIRGSFHILQAARELGTERIIQTSTSEVYGTAQTVPIPETHPLHAQSPYAASKIGADQLALSFYDSFQTPVAVIRPFNTYGPRQSDRAVIPAIITQIASGKRKIRLGSLKPTRDFNYVRDTVRGFLEVAECDAAVGEVVNIGSNYEVSIGETAQIIAEVMGAEMEIETDPQRVRPPKSEVERLWADTAKAVRLFGWKPEYAGKDGLKRGLRETARWFADPEHLKLYKTDRYNL